MIGAIGTMMIAAAATAPEKTTPKLTGESATTCKPNFGDKEFSEYGTWQVIGPGIDDLVKKGNTFQFELSLRMCLPCPSVFSAARVTSIIGIGESPKLCTSDEAFRHFRDHPPCDATTCWDALYSIAPFWNRFLGHGSTHFNQRWEYNQNTHVWDQTENFPGERKCNSVGSMIAALPGPSPYELNGKTYVPRLNLIAPVPNECFEGSLGDATILGYANGYDYVEKQLLPPDGTIAIEGPNSIGDLIVLAYISDSVEGPIKLNGKTYVPQKVRSIWKYVEGTKKPKTDEREL